MTGTLSQLRPADPEGLRVLAARERTDDDTDYIYIVEIHVPPPMLARHQGDIHLIAVPPATVDLRTVGGAKEVTRGRCASVASGRPANTYLHTYIYIYIYIYRGERVLKLCRYIYV
jgi:hypothetical protein